MTADLLRRAAVVLRCEHSFPCQPPHGSIERPGPCGRCGIAWDDRPIDDRLAEPLAAWLESVADLHEESTHRGVTRQGCQWCADEDWPCSDMRHAVATARAVLGEVSQ